MTLEDLAQLVREMRTRQKAYFRHRLMDDLRASKELERRVDEACKAVLEGPPKQGAMFK